MLGANKPVADNLGIITVTDSANEILIEAEKSSQAWVFALLALAWGLLITSALHQRGLTWFPLLLCGRIALLMLAVIGAIVSIKRRLGNLVSTYSVLAMLVQSVYAVLEGPKRNDYYEYISFFFLLAMLSLNEEPKKWFKFAIIPVLVSNITPLFFKNSEYFRSLGDFVFAYTTPIAVLFIAAMVGRATVLKIRAYRQVVELKNKIIEIEASRAKQAAHDIRSPLAALEIMASTGVDTTNPDYEERRAAVRSAASRARGIVDSILKVGNPRKPIVRGACILGVAKTIISEKRLALDGKPRIEFLLTVDGQEAKFLAKVDSIELQRTLSNLLNNALEAIEGEGCIELRLVALKDAVEIVIVDSGKGIPKEMLSRAGEKGLSWNKPGGSGLGLSHAKEFARRSGGQLRISSQVGRGTAIKLRLPSAV